VTTLFFCKDRLYVDSAHYIDGERFESLSKVRAFHEPFKVTWKPRDGVTINQETYPEAFEDTIHGYVVTGANVPADTLMSRLKKKDGDLDFVFAAYYKVMEGKFVNHLNQFTVIMIGVKACYALCVDPETVELSVVRRDNPTGYGTGGQVAVREYFRHHDAIRAMYAAFWHDDQSGGIIDVWSLPEPDSPLWRTGICNSQHPAKIMELLKQAETKRLRPDLFADELVQHQMGEAADLGECMGYLRGRGIATDPKRRSRKKAIKHMEELVKAGIITLKPLPDEPKSTTRKSTPAKRKRK
jgi:hypothetical protein